MDERDDADPQNDPDAIGPPRKPPRCAFHAGQGTRRGVRKRARVGHDGCPGLLTASEVAVVLRTSRKAVYTMAERAQLPGVTRIGRRLLVRRDDLISWLNERRATSPGGTRR